MPVIRSLVYQLYKSTQGLTIHDPLKDDMIRALNKSGQRKALSFTTLWHLFCAHMKHLSPAMIILDALDECQDPDLLIQSLKSLYTLSFVTTIVISRKERRLDNLLGNNMAFEIASEDVDSDINAFIEAKISASRLLSDFLVRDDVLSRLSSGHDGMFLWIYLMLKDLKSCFTLNHVREALAKLPEGLSGMYRRILCRLQNALNTATLDLCSKVLK